MLTLLSPVALWALATLVLPLAIHLWRQPPRTILLGSLRFLQAHKGQRLHDLRWRERLLLLIRLGLLALLVGLLAHPYWKVAPPRGPQRWILLDPTSALAGSSLEKFRALQAAGYSKHLLAPGFPEISIYNVDSNVTAPDLWSLLLEAEATLPAGSMLAVFSPARLVALHGSRPALRSKVDWVETPDYVGDASHVWIESLRPAPSPAGTPLAIFGTCDASNIRFTTSPPDGWKLDTRADTARLLDPNGSAAPWKEIQAIAPLSVNIFHDADRAEDARYLTAAIRAAAETNGVSISLHSTIITSELAAPPDADWTFWLSSASPPIAIQTRRTQWFQDAPSQTEVSPGWIIPQPNTPGATNWSTPIRYWRRGLVINGTPIWTDEHGAPLLTCLSTEQGFRWHFASRFHPDWTDLPRTTAFPAWIRALLLPNGLTTSEHDFRRAVPSQAQPSDAVAPTSTPQLPPVNTDARNLHWPIWTLAALLFLIERILSHHRVMSTAKPKASAFQTAVAR